MPFLARTRAAKWCGGPRALRVAAFTIAMVCPICITTMLVANAPVIAASIGGAAAVKLCINRTRPGAAPQPAKQRTPAKPPRRLIDPISVVRYDEQEW
ncbi:hypothetical protein TSOC_001264 [Tetrabaena socialis]|uniref:Uncharacterized protein n=1 Tax=Tetrabaena socialis TaxID=47790 RepID=A0A2J8AH65_9CHLO|nr:hypothetical protein TSOC_001264 [Tetrabaena socialis]|eukprot:PNH11857.1 hypothetical protein TSOC_001264 [Tetrabaena socialis]